MKKEKMTSVQIRKTAFELENVISDEEFLQNEGLFCYLQSCLDTLLTDVPRKVILKAEYNPENDECAATDNNTVYLNTANTVTRNIKGKKEKYLSLTGLLFHETGHILFTDFMVSKAAGEFLRKGVMYPPKKGGYQFDVMEVITDEYSAERAVTLFSFAENICEDGYVEQMMNNTFDGLFNTGLEILNRSLEDSMPDVKTSYEKEGNPCEQLLSAVFNMMLCTRKSVDMKDEGISAPEYYEIKKEVAPMVRQYINTSGGIKRREILNDIMCCILPYIPDYFSKTEKEDSLQSITGTLSVSRAPEGCTAPVSLGCRKNSVPVICDFSEIARTTLELARAKEMLQTADECGIEQYIRQRVISTEDRKKYMEIYRDVKSTSDILISKFRRLNIQRESETVTRGHITGKKFDRRHIYEDASGHFRKRTIPDGNPKLSVAILIDESGSMDGHKIEIARKTAILAYDFLQRSGVRLFVFGHTSNCCFENERDYSWDYKKDIAVIQYADPDSYDDNDRYRLRNIRARCNNKDGFVIRYVRTVLEKDFSENKLMIIITDGEPCSSGYTGEEAAEHTRSEVIECRKKGIKLAALAIDGNRETLERIYGDSYFQLDEPGELQNTILRLISRYALN